MMIMMLMMNDYHDVWSLLTDVGGIIIDLFKHIQCMGGQSMSTNKDLYGIKNKVAIGLALLYNVKSNEL